MIENREIQIEELQKGDIILFPKNSELVMAEVLTLPRKSKTNYRWNADVQRYTAVKCAVHIETIEYSRSYNDYSGIKKTYTYKKTEWKCDNKFNEDRRVDLNFKTIFLLWRNQF